MTGRVSAFESWYVCERCGWHGGLDDGLCILCQNDPATFTDPATVPAHVAFERVLDVPIDELEKRCTYCGNAHAYQGELCERCHREITADTEPTWSERYA